MGGLADPKKDGLPERFAAKVHRCINADMLPPDTYGSDAIREQKLQG